VDSAANPYLAGAFLLAAGLEGIALGLDPGEPVEDITYDWTRTGPTGGDVAATRLPRTLLEAILESGKQPIIVDLRGQNHTQKRLTEVKRRSKPAGKLAAEESITVGAT